MFYSPAVVLKGKIQQVMGAAFCCRCFLGRILLENILAFSCADRVCCTSSFLMLRGRFEMATMATKAVDRLDPNAPHLIIGSLKTEAWRHRNRGFGQRPKGPKGHKVVRAHGTETKTPGL